MARYIRNYEVIRELGAGHFGTVYLAAGEVPARGRIPGKRRLVAIKKLKNTADRESVELLLQEFSLLEQVKHRCIVRVFEYLEEENAVVMEYIHGVTLREVLEELDKAHEQVFTEAAVEIGCEIADALYQAFTTPSDNGDPLQLVHRDLKPANIMLTPNGEVKILDFGLARVDNADFARDNSDRIRGTPIYMAPEQARGEVVDHRSDLFGLGLILYELLMGEAAYRVPSDAADPLRAVFRAIEAGNLQEPCGRLEGRLPGHGPVITRMLRPRPEDRYRNGHEVMVDLRRQLYRDRGAYLQEFCEFFFGSIHDIGDPPTLDAVANTPRARQGGQKSIAERLRESMARDKQAARRLSPAPTPVTPVASPPPRSPMPSNNSGDHGGRRPPPPPVGGRASRAQTFTPGGSAPPQRRVRAIGERSPDETGMLQMVPLSDNPDEGNNNADPSATAFFAIPAPKSNRAAPAPAPAAPPPQPAAFGGGGAPPPPAFGGGGMGAPPPPAAFGGGGMGAAPPPPRAGYGQGIGVGAAAGGAIAQGPIAQAGNAGGPPPNTPFGATGPTPDNQANREQSRTRSYQVFAILFAVFFMVCVTGVGALWVIMSQQGKNNTPADPEIVAVNPTPKPPPVEEDTGEPPPSEPDPKPIRQPRPPTNPSTRPPTTQPKPEPAVKGAIVVSLASGADQVTEIRSSCSGGAGQGKVTGNSATVSVKGSGCTLRFKGPALNAKYVVSGSPSALSCSITGTVVSCR